MKKEKQEKANTMKEQKGDSGSGIDESVMLGLMGELSSSLRPYKDSHKIHDKIPKQGRKREDIIKIMEEMYAKEEKKWKDGYVSGAVYHGDEEHINFLNKIYAINSQSNPLHMDLWPSASKFEAEIVAMTANMMNGGPSSDDPEKNVCGSVTSGGTESILVAMKTYRDWARETKGITKPEMIAPVTAHAAFDKASQYFNIKMVHIPMDENYQADVEAARKAITKNTIVIVGSAPTFPQGVCDPIEELSELAWEHGIGFHTDSCLGGFILPWAEKLGYDVAPFDFRLRGVTSMSADTHKYGYAAKGTSVVMYRNPKLRHFQYYTSTEWPGGMYFSPTFAGSRPGALSAACWATLVTIGEQGYLDAAKRILEAASTIKKGIESIPELYILGNPLWVVAFNSDELNIYKVMDSMTEKGWSLNGMHKPSCVHIATTLRNAEPGVAERFVKDLKASVEFVKANPNSEGGMAPVYGMAATLPERGLISDILKMYLDLYYTV